MDLVLKTAYWDDPKSLNAFKEFMIKIFNLDLSEWESKGYWDNAYIPFSYFKGDKIVANVCIYLLKSIINGKPTRVVQISSVGTLPEWRLKGLNRQLITTGLEWAQEKHDCVFLFSTTNAIPFYEKCGFRSVNEFIDIVKPTPVMNNSKVVKLNPSKDHELERIYKYVKHRTPISDKFSIMNDKLTMFHTLYSLRNNVYEICDLDCLIFYKRNKCVLNIFDIVGEKIQGMDKIYPYISDKNDKLIKFHFHTDKLKLDHIETNLLMGNNLFIKGKFPLEKPVFPFISRS